MKSVEELARRARELKEKGLNTKEIATELHLSTNTIEWLLSRGIGEEAPKDVKIGWRSIGIYPYRISKIAEIMSDIILEEMEKRQFDVDSIVGILINGIPFATFIAEELNVEMIIYRPHPKMEEGAFSSNYAHIEGKKVVIVDDVLSTGETMRKAIEDIRRAGGEPVLCVVLVNKTPWDEIDGVPLRGLIRARIL
ncbi:orotate phosphoribosyltransferase-like protein [Euryarchaeota archaeon ex4484_178]|nr:MAG: orotate phosphoribosyltransferase-like protein [Euryarchaeota archaeon ex4484_178]